MDKKELEKDMSELLKKVLGSSEKNEITKNTFYTETYLLLSSILLEYWNISLNKKFNKAALRRLRVQLGTLKKEIPNIRKMLLNISK